MKIKLKQKLKKHQRVPLIHDKEYTVISKIFHRSNFKIEYTIIYGEDKFETFDSGFFEVSDNELIDDDWVVVELEDRMVFLPKVISYPSFWADFYTGDYEAEKKFYKRFAGEIFKEEDENERVNRN